MRIAFDHQIFLLQTHGGISRYYTRLAENLRDMGEAARIFAPVHRNEHLHSANKGVSAGIHLTKFPRGTTRLIQAASAAVAGWRARSWRPDLVHETYYAAKPTVKGKSPTVITVYDMIHELYESTLPPGDLTASLKRAAVARADHVICISENTRQDLIRLYGLPEGKTSVVHLGFDMPASGIEQGRPVSEAGKPYLLYVGPRGGHKNFDGLLRAFAASKSLQGDLDIIAFGGGILRPAELQRLAELGLARTVTQVSGGDATLHRLYAGARAFIYPSFYEGFGLPPLEAMAHACPVISSNSSSMPEVIGPAAEFFDPTDTESIRLAIESVVYSEQRRAELVSLGVETLSRYSWRRCAEATLAVYNKVAA